MSNENAKKEQTTLAATPADVGGFRIEKISTLHGTQAVKQKLEGTRRIEVTHGRIVCGSAVMDEKTRGRQTEDLAHVKDRITLPAEDAAEFVALGVAKYIDRQNQPDA